LQGNNTSWNLLMRTNIPSYLGLKLLQIMQMYADKCIHRGPPPNRILILNWAFPIYPSSYEITIDNLPSHRVDHPFKDRQKTKTKNLVFWKDEKFSCSFRNRKVEKVETEHRKKQSKNERNEGELYSSFFWKRKNKTKWQTVEETGRRMGNVAVFCIATLRQQPVNPCMINTCIHCHISDHWKGVVIFTWHVRKQDTFTGCYGLFTRSAKMNARWGIMRIQKYQSGWPKV
jgi:hypothetical protein